MKIGNAFTRAVRTGLQVLAGSVPGVPVIKGIADLAGLRAAAVSYGVAYVIALGLGASAFLTSFVQNLAEDNSGLKIPK